MVACYQRDARIRELLISPAEIAENAEIANTDFTDQTDNKIKNLRIRELKSRRNDGAARTEPSLLELCRVATEEGKFQIKEIKESAYGTGYALQAKRKISAISAISAGQ